MDNDTQNDDYQNTNNDDFLVKLRAQLQQVEGEVSERNQSIDNRDEYVYSDRLERMIDIPVGHDFTPVNWLKRTVEIHKTMFMGRPFQVISSYDVSDDSMAQDDQEQQQRQLENKKNKEFAEQRKLLIDGIIRDNGGHALFSDGAESASAVGTWVVKTFYDDKKAKFVISPIEAVENCWAVWSKDDFRSFDVFAFVNQVSKQEAAFQYGLDEDELITSPLGAPFLTSQPAGVQIGSANSSLNVATGGQTVGQPMVTVMEATGKVEGWCSKNGKLYPCPVGTENEINVVFVGNKLVRLIDDPKKLPRYYIFPNKRIRRRAWGISDITDAAININVTYIETLSDWRTIASKINFPKFKGFNFGPDSTMPKFKNRQIQLLPLSENQDLQTLPMGTDNSLEWGRQLQELKELFVRETGISRVLFDDPSVALNSNQALLTSMKPTSDIAENKKQLWTPILTQLFTDAINTIAQHRPDVKDIAEGDWWLRVQWPSMMQKEDPIYQQMLLNRFNAGTISVQSYLEAQGESNEEVDRIRDEMKDVITAGILGRALPEIAHAEVNKSLGIPPWGYVVPKVNLKGELSPNQEGNIANNFGFDSGAYPPAAGPQGYDGTRAIDNQNNQGFLNGQYPNQTPLQRGPNGQPASAAPAQVATPAQNTPGSQPASQPGSGATSTSPQGAINQNNQQNGQ